MILRHLILLIFGLTPVLSIAQSETEILEKIRTANPCSIVEISIEYEGKEHNYSIAGDNVKTKPNSVSSKNLYEIGSISKLFCGILAQQAIAENKLTLGTRIDAILPSSLKLDDQIASITVQELMTHTSGLPKLPGNLFLTKGFTMDDPYAQYDSTLLYRYLENYDGKLKKEEAHYSNLGAGLLGHMVSLLYKEDFNSLLEERIFIPLGMTNSSGENLDSTHENFLKVHSDCTEVLPWNFKVLGPAGSIKSTLADMKLFAQACMNANDKKHQAIASTYESLFKVNDRRSTGSFWIIGKYKGHKMYGHSGRTAGSASSLIIVPDMKLNAIVLNNDSTVLESDLFDLIKIITSK